MFNIYSTKINVLTGDVLAIEADGLVIPANDHLWMGTGLGGSLKKEGGEEIEIEAVKQGPAPLGSVIVTNGGSLGYRRVFHAVIAGQDLKVQIEMIGSAIASTLESAGGCKIKKMVITPLESGESTGTFNDATKALAAALIDNLGEKNSPEEIILIVADEEKRKGARDILLKTLGGGG